MKSRGHPPKNGYSVNYNQYALNCKQKILSIMVPGVVLFLIGFMFYKLWMPAVMLSMLSLLYPKMHRAKLLERRKRELVNQFKNGLYSLSSALAAGKSVENAMKEVENDLLLLYPDGEADIVREIRLINRKIANGTPVELAIRDLSERAGCEDITNFSDVFITCKRTGGDLIEVIRRTSNMIGEKLDIQQEIAVMVAQKRFESKIMGAAPFAIVAVITYSSPDYMAPLYGGKGYLIMTITLLMLAGCFLLTNKLMNIKV